MKRNKPYRVGDRLAINEPYLVIFHEEGDEREAVIGVHPGRGCRTVKDYAALLAAVISHIAIDVEPAIEPMTVWGWVEHARRRGDVTWRAMTPGVSSPAPNSAGVLVMRDHTKPSGDCVGLTVMLACGEEGWGHAATLEPMARLVVAAVEAIASRLNSKPNRVWQWLERCWGGSNATACDAKDFFGSLPEAAMP